MSSPLIVTGMHRSGTSLVSSFLCALGIHMGQDFYPADYANPKGYYEDVDFLAFQRRVLAECCPPGAPGWHDVGWTESEVFYRGKLQQYAPEAQALLAPRYRHSCWGWKEPRTSLLLDFWHDLAPEARYLFLYRFPWDVSDSLLRLNQPLFDDHPDYPLRIWAYYNRHLLDFYQRHRDRCLLVNINALIEAPEKFVALLERKLEITSADDERPAWLGKFEAEMFRSLDHSSDRVRLLQVLSPQYFSQFAEMDQAADLPSSFLYEPIKNSPAREGLLSRLCHHQVKQRIEMERLQASLDDAQAQASQLRFECAQWQAQNEVLHQEVAGLQSEMAHVREKLCQSDAELAQLSQVQEQVQKTKAWKLSEWLEQTGKRSRPTT